MKSTLEEILLRLETRQEFNKLMRDKKYINKDLSYTIAEENSYQNMYEIDSLNVLKSLLIKTHFRLLVQINKGAENLVDIINNPSEWSINRIDNDPTAWIDKKVLIFTTETAQAVFTHVSRGKGEYKFIDGKWQ